jgi:hypothetical protein
MDVGAKHASPCAGAWMSANKDRPLSRGRGMPRPYMCIFDTLSLNVYCPSYGSGIASRVRLYSSAWWVSVPY